MTRSAMDQPCALRLTRRGIVAAAPALGLVAFGRRASAATAPGPISPHMLRLSEYMAAASQRALPPQANLRARLHTLDTFAAMVSGSQLKPGVVAIRFAKAHAGKAEASVAGSAVRCSSMDAALANGMLAHSDETDDSHEGSNSHPGCAVVPAALAAGEQEGISGAHFLRAVALGYDVGTRIMPAIGRGKIAHRSSHAIVSGFGAAAAAGCAVKLDAQRMRWMLDYAAQQSSGLNSLTRDLEHIEKAFSFGGMGARSGTTAAMVVLAGWTGVDDVFSGDDNFFDAYAGNPNPAAALLDGLGERFEITRTNIKKWTVGSPIQAALDSLEVLLKQDPFTADQVTRVVVRLSNGEGAVNNREMPDINLQHMVALMLVDRGATFKSAHDFERMKDPKVLAVRTKVEMRGAPELTANGGPSRQAIVDVTLADGRTLSHHTREVRGTITNPMTEAEVIAKADELMAPILGAAQTKRLIQTVMSLDQVSSIRPMARMLQTRS